MPKGLYIIFDGIEYCGKTTQTALLGEGLKEKGLEYLSIREPGQTELGEEIREILLHERKFRLDPITELFLFEANRSYIFSSVVISALEKGTIVTSDRSRYASSAYQGSLKGCLSKQEIEILNNFATRNIKPDLAFFLDLPYKKALERTRIPADKLEQRSRKYHERVRKSYLEIAREDLNRIQVINAENPVEKIQQEIREILNKRFGLGLSYV